MASSRFAAAEILNSRFGEDFDSLKDVDRLYEEYSAKEKDLLSSISQSEKQTSHHLQAVMKSCENLLQDIGATSAKIDEIMENYKLHNKNTKNMEIELTNLNNEVKALANKQLYLSWKNQIEKLSSEVHSHIQKKNIQLAVECHLEMYNICSNLQQTTCGKMKTYSFDSSQHVYEELKEILSKELDLLLTAMKYPFSTGISSPLFIQKDETEERFRKAIGYLSKLKSLSEQSEYSLLSIQLTKPINRRFHFHFYGERHTNNIEKPQWYFTQIINWIRDHSSFLEDYVQVILTDNNVAGYKIKDEFCKIVVKLCEEKLKSSIHGIVKNDILLAHYIDETLMFEKELQHCVIEPTMGCLYIILEDDFLDHWLSLEKKFALESMTEMLFNKDAWLSTYSELNSQEKIVVYFVPRCVEEFMTLLSLMTDRHKSLNNHYVQLKFLNVVVESISEFITKVKHLALVEVIRPESQHFCAILNGMYYIYHVLMEWTDDLYYMQLLEPSDTEEERASKERAVELQNDDSIFSEVLNSLEVFIDGLVESLTEYFETGLKSKIKAYRSERWHALPCLKDYIVPILSSSACDLILFVKVHLNTLEEILCADVFQKVWKEAAKVIDHLVFIEVPFECHFNEGGASQFQFDIKKNLFTVFGEYTNKPDSYFKLLKDSCTILNLLPGSAVLLKEVFAQADKTSKTADQQEDIVRTSLNDIGVKHLTLSQASRIIKARIDWPKI